MPSPPVQTITDGKAVVKNKGGRPRKVPVEKARLAPLDHSSLVPKKGAPRSLQAFVEKVLKLYAPHMIPLLMEETRNAMSGGDKDALERTAKMFGLIGSKGIVINNTANAGASANAGPSNGDRVGFEAVIRRMNAEKSVVDVQAG